MTGNSFLTVLGERLRLLLETWHAAVPASSPERNESRSIPTFTLGIAERPFSSGIEYRVRSADQCVVDELSSLSKVAVNPRVPYFSFLLSACP